MAISNETIDERPISSIFSSGRMFYLVNNIVYFSQVMEGNNIAFLAKCYQKNDPTAEQLSDLLDTDGGTIPINEANKGIKLVPITNGVLVLCDNGVWQISGPEAGFTATDFSVIKVTTHGCISAQSVVQVSESTYYWGNKHIHLIQKNEFAILEEISITEETIEKFFDGIDLSSKKHAYGFYNSRDSKVEWFYSTLTTEGTSDNIFTHDRGITLDLNTNGLFIQQFNGKLVQSTTIGTSLIGGVDLSSIRSDGIFYLSYTQQNISTASTMTLKVGRRDDELFQDFGTDFSIAFLESGYEALQKPSNSKTAPYITTYFKRTEENFVIDGAGLKLDKQSSCQLRAQWDWNDTIDNGRFSPFQQVYRFRRIFTPSGPGPFNSGETVITTKNKVLGRGKALSLRFEQESGKDMQLLGWTNSWSIKSKM